MKQTMILCALEVAKNLFDCPEMRGARIRCKSGNLIHRVSEVWSSRVGRARDAADHGRVRFVIFLSCDKLFVGFCRWTHVFREHNFVICWSKVRLAVVEADSFENVGVIPGLCEEQFSVIHVTLDLHSKEKFEFSLVSHLEF